MTRDPWESKVLDRDTHKRLVEGAVFYAALAGVPEPWLWEPLSAHVGALERAWVSRFRASVDRSSQGILYCGEFQRGDTPSVMERMSAITGALVRNFVDARMRSIESLAEFDDGESAGCTVLLLPNFCISNEAPSYKVREAVSSAIVSRLARGKQTLVYALSPAAAERAYGPAVAQILSTQYLPDPR